MDSIIFKYIGYKTDSFINESAIKIQQMSLKIEKMS